MLIVIEGLDASGKATQSKLLAERLGAKRFTFPDYETQSGHAILRHLKSEIEIISPGYNPAKEDPMFFQALCSANKYETVPKMISAHLSGDIVCDRWWQSAVAYGMADGLDEKWLKDIHVALSMVFMKSGVVNIFLDVPEDEALRRRPEVRDRYERDREKQKRVREIYKIMWASRPGWYIVDGLGTVEEVQGRIRVCVEKERDL